MQFANSQECTTSELDLFMIPAVQTSIEEGIWDTIQPHPNFQTGTIQFDIPATSTHYVNMSETELHVTAMIRKIDTADTTKTTIIAAADEIGPINNFMHSMFSQIEVFLNNESVENSNNTYGYRAYLDNLLNFNKESKETFLQTDLYYQDTAGEMENLAIEKTPYKVELAASADTPPVYSLNVTEENQVNQGYIARRNRCIGKAVEMKGRIHSDIFNINKYMLSNVNITIKLSRMKEQFCLLGKNGDWKIYIEKAVLKVRRSTISPSIMMAHAMALEKTAARYPLKRVVVKPFTLPLQTTKTTLAGIHNGYVPKRVVIGFVDTETFNGTYKTNPYNFKHYNLTNLVLKVASKATPYSSGLSFDFPNARYIDGYNTLFQGIREYPTGINYQDYAKGYTLFAFDLSPDLCSDERFSLLQDGYLDLDITFGDTPQNSITAIIYMEFDNIIHISKTRLVTYDYNKI